MKKYKFIFGIAFTAIMITLIGINVNLVLSAESNPSDMTLNGIEALSTENPCNPCPDPYDVPNRYIKLTATGTASVTSNASGQIYITLGGQEIVRGGYAKNTSITIFYRVFNCEGEQEGSCCQQSSVRVEI